MGSIPTSGICFYYTRFCLLAPTETVGEPDNTDFQPAASSGRLSLFKGIAASNAAFAAKADCLAWA